MSKYNFNHKWENIDCQIPYLVSKISFTFILHPPKNMTYMTWRHKGQFPPSWWPRACERWTSPEQPWPLYQLPRLKTGSLHLGAGKRNRKTQHSCLYWINWPYFISAHANMLSSSLISVTKSCLKRVILIIRNGVNYANCQCLARTKAKP